MAKKSEVFEGTVTAQIGLRINEVHASWRVLGTVELPYKIRAYMQPDDETETVTLTHEPTCAGCQEALDRAREATPQTWTFHERPGVSHTATIRAEA